MEHTIKASIVISSYNRLGLFRRTLWSIANKGPSVPFELIVVDDGSSEDILSELKLYSSRFYWKFVKFDAKKFEETTGMTKFLNNPCTTNNIGVRLASGDLIFQQGNEIIAFDGCYDQLIKDAPTDSPYFMVMSTTYDVPGVHLDSLDKYGSNINQGLVEKVRRWPLQDKHYRSDVTNYISLAGKNVWEALGGCDERYYGGISAEDSDFVRRARTLPDFKQVISDGISLHQYHSGKTCYYDPPASIITKDRWNEGVQINHAIYNNWDGKTKVPVKWDWGTLGVGEVITNG